MIMSLDYITLFVGDVQESKRFYQDLLGLRVLYESPNFVLLSAPAGSKLGLHLAEGERGSKQTVNLHFRVADVDEAYARLSAQGLSFEHVPKRQPWGLRSAAFRDPDGYLVELVAPDE